MNNLIQSLLIAVLMSTTGAQDVIYKYVQVGETITLNPPRETSSQEYLYWLFDDLELAWRNPLGGSGLLTDDQTETWKNIFLSGDSLTIKTIQQKQFGIFVCNVMLNMEKKIKATVTYKLLELRVSLNPSSPLLPGESFDLHCDTPPTSNKKPEIRWLNPQGQKMEISQGTLALKATGQYNGQWTCVVTNDEKITKVPISVTVVDLSSAPLHPQYTSKYSPLTIPCSIPSIPSKISWEQIRDKGIEGGHWQFFPKPGSSLISADPQRVYSLSLEDPISWKADQDRELTFASDFKKGDLSLTRKQGREEDRGNYVCTLKFKNGVTLSRTVHVNVLQIISSPGTNLISGQQVNLTCSLGYPLPFDLQVKWFSPEQPSLQVGTSGHLIIPEVGTRDSGKWRCELWQNNTRLTRTEITLRIEPKLSVWMLVIICSVTVIVFLLLVVLTFILRRRRQQKMRPLRHRLCQCKNPKPKGFYRT